MENQRRQSAAVRRREARTPLYTAVSIMVVSVGLAALITAVVQPIVTGEFTRIEERGVTADLERAGKLVEAHLDVLARIAADYGQWDDTVSFIGSRDAAYVRSNLQGASLHNLDVTAYLFFDATGQVVHTVRVASKTGGTKAVSPALVAQVKRHIGLLRLADPQDRGREVIKTDDGVFLAGSAPILPTDGTLPVRGTMVVLREVDAELIEHGEEQLGIDLSAAVPGRMDHDSPMLESIAEQLGTSAATQVAVLGPTEIGAMKWLRDDDGVPVFTLAVVQPRPLYASSMRVARMLVVVILGAGILLGLATVLLVEAVSRARTSRQMEVLIGQDHLTGLPNRRHFEQALDHEIARTEEEGGEGAVLWLDLDGFKTVNDTLGHHAGDRLLVTVADILAHVVRTGDVVARIGGDEFAILLPQTGADEAAGIAQRLIDHLQSTDAPLDGHSARLSASVGLVVFPRDGVDPERLFVLADVAMYAAKNAGGGAYRFADDPSDRGDDLGEYGRMPD